MLHGHENLFWQYFCFPFLSEFKINFYIVMNNPFCHGDVNSVCHYLVLCKNNFVKNVSYGCYMDMKIFFGQYLCFPF